MKLPRNFFFLSVAVLAVSESLPARPPEPASAEGLRAKVEWLADEAREGRRTGEKGARESAEYIAKFFQEAGLGPVGGGYFQSFEFDAGVKLIPDANHLEIPGGKSFEVDKDFRPLAFSENGEAEGEVVFVGYGLIAPEEDGRPRYDSYAGVDVKDKIVLVLRYVPEGVDSVRRAQLNRYAGLRYKAMLAREHGAKAVLFVSGPNSPQAGKLFPLAGDGSLSDSEVIAVSLSGEAAAAFLPGKSLKDLQTALDSENPHAESGFVLPKVKVKVGLEHIKKQDRNVLGAIPPNGTEEWVVVGAHYDHLGLGGGGNSLARSGEEGKAHVGADDNASGTAVVMDLAAVLSRERKNLRAPHRGILFALWSGEEMGLLGSSAFAKEPPVKPIAAYVNFDMVGRLRDNRLVLQGAGSSKTWRKMIEKRNAAAGFGLVVQDDPYLPTDVTSFYQRKIPVLNFFTGAHEDYHRPSDTADKVNYEGLERITRFAGSLVRDLAEAPDRPEYVRVERSEGPQGGRETLRAYLGTIPDYTAEAKGVKIAGVRGGSPAEKAGLTGDDVIVEFAGQKIANIYDYTYALDAVKIGRAVEVKVLRGGETVSLNVVPEARK